MPLLCWLFGHDWHYFDLGKIRGGRVWFRCCLRCEKSEKIVRGD